MSFWKSNVYPLDAEGAGGVSAAQEPPIRLQAASSTAENASGGVADSAAGLSVAANRSASLGSVLGALGAAEWMARFRLLFHAKLLASASRGMLRQTNRDASAR
jgi:hypothetical protein